MERTHLISLTKSPWILDMTFSFFLFLVDSELASDRRAWHVYSDDDDDRASTMHSPRNPRSADGRRTAGRCSSVGFACMRVWSSFIGTTDDRARVYTCRQLLRTFDRSSPKGARSISRIVLTGTTELLLATMAEAQLTNFFLRAVPKTIFVMDRYGMHACRGRESPLTGQR